MDTKFEVVVKVIQEAAIPLQRKLIRRKIPKHILSDSALGYILTTSVEKGFLAGIKYKGKPTFYAHPDWVDKGKLTKDFDPIFKQWKTPIHAAKN